MGSLQYDRSVRSISSVPLPGFPRRAKPPNSARDQVPKPPNSWPASKSVLHLAALLHLAAPQNTAPGQKSERGSQSPAPVRLLSALPCPQGTALYQVKCFKGLEKVRDRRPANTFQLYSTPPRRSQARDLIQMFKHHGFLRLCTAPPPELPSLPALSRKHEICTKAK